MTSGSQSATEGQTLSITASTGPVFVNFSANRSSDPDGTVTGWDWKIDGSSVSNASSFAYGLDVGSHTVSLIVTDNQGAFSQDATGSVAITLAPASFFLTFPLTKIFPYSARISSILDHSGKSFYSTSDNTDLAYTGEKPLILTVSVLISSLFSARLAASGPPGPGLSYVFTHWAFRSLI